MAYRSKKAKRAASLEIAGVIIIAVAIIICLGIYTGTAGLVGAKFKEICLGVLGLFAYIVPVALLAYGIYLTFFLVKKWKGSTIAFYCVIGLCIVCILHMACTGSVVSVSYFGYIKDCYTMGIVKSLGAGAIGGIVCYPIILLFGKVGSYIFFLALGLVCALIATNLSMRNVKQGINERVKEHSEQRSVVREERHRVKEERRMAREQRLGKDGEFRYSERDSSGKLKVFDVDSQPPETVGGAVPLGEAEEDIDFFPGFASGRNHSYIPSEKPSFFGEDGSISQEEEDDAIPPFFTRPTKKAERADIKAEGDADSVPVLQVDSAEKPAAFDQNKPYQFPPLSMLSKPQSGKGMRSLKADSRSSANLLERTFENFGVKAKVLNVRTGPSVTQYEVQPAPGVKVSKIVNLSDDIALSLAAPGVRIEAPIPGKNAIGIEVPNRERQPVVLREVLESQEFIGHPSKVAVALGKDIAGDNIVIDLAKMPHLLIAGTTGSGKSVCINTLITSLLFKSTPEEVKMIMIDPKVVELSAYNGIPHMMVPVVTDPKKAAGALNWAVAEMTRRYNAFAEQGAKEMSKYNDIMKMLDEPKLPYIVVVVDELADLMMVAPRDVEDAICRIAQMGRAAGIHLVVATQRPSVDVITGLIKANFPSRIAFAVSSQTDSRTILDAGGAEKLLGRGDMLFHTSSLPKPVRIQGAFLSDPEVEAVIAYIQKQDAAPEYNETVIEQINQAAEAAGGAEKGESGDKDHADELLADALALFIDAGQASTSMLQRRFRIGYARAARLTDEMEQLGYISQQEGSKPRNVLISRSEYNEIFGKEI